VIRTMLWNLKGGPVINPKWREPSGGNMRIVIVEDEILIAQSMADLLTDEGHHIVGLAGSADQVIQILKDQTCDLAILDANLAGSNICPVAAALGLRSIPFIVVSGYPQRDLVLPLRSAPFLPKPVRREDLLAAVAAMSQRDKLVTP
jgi:DNA-binding response OmpR family regulator